MDISRAREYAHAHTYAHMGQYTHNYTTVANGINGIRSLRSKWWYNNIDRVRNRNDLDGMRNDGIWNKIIRRGGLCSYEMSSRR